MSIYCSNRSAEVKRSKQFNYLKSFIYLFIFSPNQPKHYSGQHNVVNGMEKSSDLIVHILGKSPNETSKNNDFSCDRDSFRLFGDLKKQPKTINYR